jgi:hypothetical protein
MARFETQDGDLFIDGNKVLKAWESFSGWYWFATEKAHTQDSVVNGKVIENDQIWFGFVQGFEEEWGCFSEGELNSLGPWVWEIPERHIPFAGRMQVDCFREELRVSEVRERGG